MGCSSTKQTATKVDEAKTLLTSPAAKTSLECVVQHHVAHVALKRGALDRVVEVASNPETKRIFDGVTDLIDVQIMLAGNHKLIVQSTIRAETKATIADSKIDEVLTLLQDVFASEPVRFTATGGNVQLAGQEVWSLACPGVVQHVVFCALTKQDAVGQVPEQLNSDIVQKQLTNAVGLVSMEVIMQADRKMFVHARFVSKQAFQASEGVMQDVIDSLNDVLEEKQEQQFKAVGGCVKLAGSVLWSFPNLPRLAPDDEDTTNQQQFPSKVEASIGREVKQLVVQPRALEATGAPNSWFFGTCCASPAIAQD